MEKTTSACPLGLFSCHVQGPFFCKSHKVWFFYPTRDYSKDDVSATQGLLLWDKYFWYNQYQHDSRKITRFFTSSIASMLLSYCLNFPETWIYINILIPISILNSLSTQLFPRNSFFLLFKRSIKKLVFQSKLLVKLWLKLLWS